MQADRFLVRARSFALNEAKMALIRLYRKFTFRLTPRNNIPMKLVIVMTMRPEVSSKH